MEYSKIEKINLKDHFNEKWLQDIIEKEPEILGLGKIETYARERKQSSGGRIDFLMGNSDSNTMYEVEIMLGKTDESHIIRTIEYWDIERKRFPSKDHKAVIVAEDITNRFFNVIALMNKSIPIIAIQLSAFKHGDNVFLDFVKVLDIYESPEDEEDFGFEAVDRSHWKNKCPKNSIKLVDDIIAICKAEYEGLRITYNKHHIAIGAISKNFMWLNPRKTDGYCHIELFVGKENIETSISAIESLGLTYTIRKEKKITFSITSPTFETSKELIAELMTKSLNYNK